MQRSEAYREFGVTFVMVKSGGIALLIPAPCSYTRFSEADICT
jgi:hypothetical protein